MVIQIDPNLSNHTKPKSRFLMDIYQLLGIEKPSATAIVKDEISLKRRRRPIQHPPVAVNDIYVTRTGNINSLYKRAMSLLQPLAHTVKQGKQRTRIVDVINGYNNSTPSDIKGIDIKIHGVGKMVDKAEHLLRLLVENNFGKVSVLECKRHDVELVDDFVNSLTGEWCKSTTRTEKAIHITMTSKK